MAEPAQPYSGDSFTTFGEDLSLHSIYNKMSAAYKTIHNGYLTLDQSVWVQVQRHLSPEQQRVARKVMDGLPEAAFNLLIVGSPTSGVLPFCYFLLRTAYAQRSLDSPEKGQFRFVLRPEEERARRSNPLLTGLMISEGVRGVTSAVSGLVNRNLDSLVTGVLLTVFSAVVCKKIT